LIKWCGLGLLTPRWQQLPLPIFTASIAVHSPFIQKSACKLVLVCKDCAGRYRAILLIYLSAKPPGAQGPKLQT